MNLDLPLKRRPGTPPPKPRDCSAMDEPEPEPEPEPSPDRDHEPQANDPDPSAEATCMFRPVNARVRGRMVDARSSSRSTAASSRSSGAPTPRAASASRSSAGRSRAAGTRPAGEGRLRPEREARARSSCGSSFRRCPERATPKAVQAGPAAKCGARPFLAWVRGARIRGRLLPARRQAGSAAVSVADWRGRYGVTVNPARLREGKHVVTARIEFLPGSDLKQRTVRLSFRKCCITRTIFPKGRVDAGGTEPRLDAQAGPHRDPRWRRLLRAAAPDRPERRRARPR